MMFSRWNRIVIINQAQSDFEMAISSQVDSPLWLRCYISMSDDAVGIELRNALNKSLHESEKIKNEY